MATGKVRLGAMKPIVWFWIGVAFVAMSVAYWRIEAGKLQAQKANVSAKQRAVRATLGQRLLPFVERVEDWTSELAKAATTDELIVGEVSWDTLARMPGVYLRLNDTRAKDVEGIRRAAASSLNDGFTSCFFIREGLPDPTQGPKCVTSASCEPGLLCNEWDVCSAVPRPYNMRLAYRAWRVLSDDFTRTLQDASDELKVRILDRELDQVTRVDVPVAIEVLQRAKTVTIVLDEVPEELKRTPVDATSAPVLSEEQKVQGVPHAAKVGIWDVLSGRQLVRWRGQAQSRLVSVGKRVELEPEVAAARDRQANSCLLATSLKARLIAHASEQPRGIAGGVAESGK